MGLRQSTRRYYETTRRLKAEQLRHQVGRRLRRAWPVRRAVAPPRPLQLSPHWGPRVSRDRRAVDRGVLDGTFRAWGREARVDLSGPWLAAGQGRSWNYLLHYFDEAPTLAEAGKADPVLARRICRFLESWIQAHPFARGLAWEPYPTALRLVNWLDVLRTLGETVAPDWRQQVLDSLYVQTAWLQKNYEHHLQGSHLLKDIKAVLLATSVFRDPAMQHWGREANDLLQRELNAQIQADGGHLEPSTMYHCMVLEDLLDLLNFRGAVEGATRELLLQTAQRMLRYARVIETPIGSYPHLGDAWEGGAPPPRDLFEYARRLDVQVPEPMRGFTWLEASGLAVWRDVRTYFLADVGDVGPPHLAAHGHCDSLSFEWWVGEVPFIVDSGTYTYEPGVQRQACRSTRAHNTLQIDDREQHEIWAAFRVARRSSVQTQVLRSGCIESHLVPWFDRRLSVRRRFECSAAEICIADRVEGTGEHHVSSRFHLHPDCAIEIERRCVRMRRGSVRAAIEIAEPAAFQLLPAEISGSSYAHRAGELQPNAVVQIEHQGRLPFESCVKLKAI